MKCIIIDDEATARMITHQLCKQVDDLEVVAQFEDAIQAIKYLNSHSVDLILLDINMPAFSGIDLVQTLKNPIPVICITGDREHAIEAFEYDNIIAYLLKPVDQQKFYSAIAKVKKSKPVISGQSTPDTAVLPQTEQIVEQFLYVNIDRRLVKIAMDSIYLIEAKGDYVLIKTEEKNYTVHSTMKKVEDKLPVKKFLKVHRSFIINILKIVDIEDNSVLIKRDVIPVSRSKKPILLQRLNLL